MSMQDAPGIGVQRWVNLVSETQFAADLILTGIRRVSRLPMEGSLFGPISYDQTFPLHAGLHAYTSGLERLCKLAIACDGFAKTGSFTSVRQYSHHFSKLFDAIEDLGPFVRSGIYSARPADEYEPGLVKWLEHYSSGSGRYELLDSLATNSAVAPTWEMWVAFCGEGSVSPSVRQSICLQSASAKALRDIASEHSLESVASSLLEDLEVPLSEKSASVGLAMYRRARWVASILNAVTYSAPNGLPILQEALRGFYSTTDDFFAYEVARLSDPDAVEDELVHHLENFTSSFTEDDDWVVDEELTALGG